MATTVPSGSSAPQSSQRRNPPPPCQVCNKRYTSWKALFGHMRSHPERSWRGVHPPPRFDGHRQREIIDLTSMGDQDEYEEEGYWFSSC
ncbi:hypothetical protein M0R45_003843 [Rubus argutus]|uniref:C2H2-type domain-containing protein n=1 Tax=Rubus argutus TaxID=59490 RepID=A0AAW1YHH2_RUBAR